MGLNIIKCTSTVNTTSCNRTPEYIVLHYTAGVNSNPGAAKGTASYFAKPSTGASADFIVDQGTVVQYNPDPTKHYCWAVGGSKYTKPSTSEGGKYYGKATNKNSVSIEMCSNKKSTKTLNATDTDWYLHDSVVENALALTKYLMDLYHIPAEKVICHHHVTGKICPNPWFVNESRLSEWKKFKDKLKSGSPTSSTSNTTSNTVEKKETTTAPAEKSSMYYVFAGSFSSNINAKNRYNYLKSKGYNCIIKTVDGYYKVQAGAYKNKTSADKLAKELSRIAVTAYVVCM